MNSQRKSKGQPLFNLCLSCFLQSLLLFSSETCCCFCRVLLRFSWIEKGVLIRQFITNKIVFIMFCLLNSLILVFYLLSFWMDDSSSTECVSSFISPYSIFQVVHWLHSCHFISVFLAFSEKTHLFVNQSIRKKAIWPFEFWVGFQFNLSFESKQTECGSKNKAVN